MIEETDTQIAERIEPKPDKLDRSDHIAWRLVEDYVDGDHPRWIPKSFISAPTKETGRILKERNKI